jgi:hypothetical protein
VFIGHFAVGFAAKRLAPRTSLGLLMLATLFLDALWPVFLLAAVERVRIDPGNTAFTPLDLHDYPYSHSLLMAVVWSLAVAGVGFLARRNGKLAWLLAGAVFSHWVLDFVTHRPDLPLAPGSARFAGLGLWNSIVGTVVVEGAMFGIGVALYARATRPTRRSGTVVLVALVSLLTILYLIDLVGPPPPSPTAIAVVGLCSTLVFVPWAIWIDRNRAPVADLGAARTTTAQ